VSIKVKLHDLVTRVHESAPWVCQGCGDEFSDTEVMHGVMDECPWGSFLMFVNGKGVAGSGETAGS
jgi:hypothetical protein